MVPSVPEQPQPTSAGPTTISAVHPDIIRTNILTRLDGPSLASAACASSQLYALSTEEDLWTDICHSTWPSTSAPRLDGVISTFPSGFRSFFSASFPLITSSEPPATSSSPGSDPPSEIISAVDVYYKGEPIFCKVIETETVTGWFRCSPFRLDLLDPKDVVPTGIKYPEGEATCRELGEDLTLSWILIDPVGRRAVNLSSHRPLSIQRHWLTGEVQVRFATILSNGERGSSSELAQCGVVVTCGESQAGELVVREVSLQMEDMDGTYLNGKDSLGILQRALEGKIGRRGRGQEEAKKAFQVYLERRKGRKERQQRAEGALDMLFMAIGVLAFVTFCFVVLCR